MELEASKNLWRGSLAAICCESLFGLSYLFTKSATGSATALALLGWRFVLAFFIMTLMVMFGFIKVNLKGKKLKPLLSVSIFSPCLYFFGETVGINHTIASESGILLACIPIASLICSSLILKEIPSKFQIIGILTTLFGVLLIIAALGLSSSLSIIGYSFLLMGVLAYALYSVFVEKAVDYSDVEITYIMLLMGALCFSSLALGEALWQGQLSSLLMIPFKDQTFSLAVIYQGLACSIGAFFLSNYAISKIGVNRTSSFVGISTVVSILAGNLILGESISILQILGAIIILIGVYTANINFEK